MHRCELAAAPMEKKFYGLVHAREEDCAAALVFAWPKVE
jgi:hypothetical protein